MRPLRCTLSILLLATSGCAQKAAQAPIAERTSDKATSSPAQPTPKKQGCSEGTASTGQVDQEDQHPELRMRQWAQGKWLLVSNAHPHVKASLSFESNTGPFALLETPHNGASLKLSLDSEGPNGLRLKSTENKHVLHVERDGENQLLSWWQGLPELARGYRVNPKPTAALQGHWHACDDDFIRGRAPFQRLTFDGHEIRGSSLPGPGQGSVEYLFPDGQKLSVALRWEGHASPRLTHFNVYEEGRMLMWILGSAKTVELFQNEQEVSPEACEARRR